MLTLTGKVMNVLETPKGIKKDGTEYGGYHQVQLLTNEVLRNGSTRLPLLNLTTDAPKAFEGHIGHSVAFTVSAWARAQNDIVFQIADSEKPVRVEAEKKAS